MNYDDEVLVPLEYSYACYSPNDDGQTFFGNDGDYRVFDRDGNEIFQIDRKIKAVSDGVVLWQEEDPETFLNNFGYVNLDGTVVYEPVVILIIMQEKANALAPESWCAAWTRAES